MDAEKVSEEPARYGPGRSSLDDVIDVYKREVDMTLIAEGAKRSFAERLEDFDRWFHASRDLRGIMNRRG